MADLKRTPLAEQHRALGARMVPFAGWEMPVQYSGIKVEHLAVREHAGLFDVSHMGELFVSGERALEAVDRLVTNDLSKLAVGHALYTCACNEAGGILDDLIVYRVADDRVLVVCNAGNREKIAAHFAERLSGVGFEDASDSLSLLALQGPQSLAIVEAAGAGELVDLPRHATAEIQLFGRRVRAARTGYTGEDGFEILLENEGAPHVWSALLEVGRPHGLVPVGLGARDTLRLEACLRLYGNDIDETTNPLEAGLGFTVKLDAGEFVGREALARIKADGISRKLVGIEMIGKGIARHGYPVRSGGETIGHVTSGGPCPSLNKNLGLCYVPVSLARIGQRVDIEIRDKAVEAQIVNTPFYKRSR
jgi:aminomethyltransferase